MSAACCWRRSIVQGCSICCAEAGSKPRSTAFITENAVGAGTGQQRAPAERTVRRQLGVVYYLRAIGWRLNKGGPDRLEFRRNQRHEGFAAEQNRLRTMVSGSLFMVNMQKSANSFRLEHTRVAIPTSSATSSIRRTPAPATVTRSARRCMCRWMARSARNVGSRLAALRDPAWSIVTKGLLGLISDKGTQPPPAAEGTCTIRSTALMFPGRAVVDPVLTRWRSGTGRSTTTPDEVEPPRCSWLFCSPRRSSLPIFPRRVSLGFRRLSRAWPRSTTPSSGGMSATGSCRIRRSCRAVHRHALPVADPAHAGREGRAAPL